MRRLLFLSALFCSLKLTATPKVRLLVPEEGLKVVGLVFDEENQQAGLVKTKPMQFIDKTFGRNGFTRLPFKTGEGQIVSFQLISDREGSLFVLAESKSTLESPVSSYQLLKLVRNGLITGTYNHAQPKDLGSGRQIKLLRSDDAGQVFLGLSGEWRQGDRAPRPKLSIRRLGPGGNSNVAGNSALEFDIPITSFDMDGEATFKVESIIQKDRDWIVFASAHKIVGNDLEIEVIHGKVPEKVGRRILAFQRDAQYKVTLPGIKKMPLVLGHSKGIVLLLESEKTLPSAKNMTSGIELLRRRGPTLNHIDLCQTVSMGGDQTYYLDFLPDGRIVFDGLIDHGRNEGFRTMNQGQISYIESLSRDYCSQLPK